MGAFGSWSSKPELGIGNASYPQCFNVLLRVATFHIVDIATCSYIMVKYIYIYTDINRGNLKLPTHSEQVKVRNAQLPCFDRAVNISLYLNIKQTGSSNGLTHPRVLGLL